MTRQSRIRALACAAGALAVFGLVAFPGAARAAFAEDPVASPESVSTSMRYQVTLAARSCPDYSKVMAGRVRDDDTEAATAPGRDNSYADGQAVSPDVESAAGGCTPLTGWSFTFGTGHERKSALSVVTGAIGDSGGTQAEVPLLDSTGHATTKTLSGAVTVVLTDAQVAQAIRAQLYVQGGTPADPLLSQSRPGYAFGALRCGSDGRSDTNTQWIGFPAGVRHVFCFAYYVKSAGPPATLIVQARTTRDVGYPQRFTFDASMSYAADHTITLATGYAPVTRTLVRTAGGAPGHVVAHTPDGWRLSDLSCSKSGSGQSAVTIDPTTGTIDATLAPQEIVTCTYTFDPPPVGAGLAFRVFSDNAGGTVQVGLTGTGGPYSLRASPAGDGSAAPATGADLTALTPGQYALTVGLPSSAWSLTGLVCNGTVVRTSGLTAQLTLSIGQPLDCTVRVSHPAGSLDLRAVTVGGVGSAAFVVAPLAGGGTLSGVATTTGFGVPSSASGVPTVPFGSYLVTPLAPPSTVDGSWQLGSFTCDPGDKAGAGIDNVDVVPLTAGTDQAKCVATFQFVAAPTLQLVLRFAGEPDGRASPAVIEVACDDGSHGRVVLAAADLTEQQLPAKLGFLDPSRCIVQPPADGAAPGAAASVAAELSPAFGNAPLSLPASVDISHDVGEYTVTVTITYHAATDVPRQARILTNPKVLPVALIGAGLVGLGLVILMVMVVRSRGV